MDQDGKHPDFDICSDIFNLILMIQNLPQVNVQKYQSMLLGSRAEANTINLHVDGVSIEQLKSIKLFDVHLDSELNFSEHVNSVLQKG